MHYGVSGRAPSIIAAALAILLTAAVQLLAAERSHAATAMHAGAGLAHVQPSVRQ